MYLGRILIKTRNLNNAVPLYACAISTLRRLMVEIRISSGIDLLGYYNFTTGLLNSTRDWITPRRWLG